jgi:hypothetical protein
MTLKFVEKSLWDGRHIEVNGRFEFVEKKRKEGVDP